jgi:uncharacterized repeat protein (TIGR01451 family)
MRKTTAVLLSLIFITAFAGAAAAAQGTATIYPASLTPSAYHPVITITYKPAATGTFVSGSLEIDMNKGFSPAPSSVTTSAGAVTAVIMVGGTTPAPVDPANITIDGYAVTINAITLNQGDYIQVTYGSSGTGGLYGPAASGLYYFNVYEKTSSVNSFVMVDLRPFIYVSNVTLSKTCSANTILAGNTVTYTIMYHNNSSGYSMTGASVWDTMPSGITFISSQPSPSTASGGFYGWNIGSLSVLATSSITITASVNAGIASYGLTSVNTASVSAISVTGEANVMNASSTVNVQGAVIMAGLTASPDLAVAGGNITVVMNMDNSGNLEATNISPSSMSPVGTGSVTLLNGPIPTSVGSLAANSACSFTWVYQANSAGTLHFSSHAYASDNSQGLMTNYLNSNNVTIQTPTLTSTPTPTQAAATYTPTSWVPSATATVYAPNATATNTPVVSPTVVPAEKVRTDRNFINIGKGDTLKIDYTVDRDGETAIRIYNLNGEIVRDFYNLTLKAGAYEAAWDGTNDKGNKVGKGMYFIVVKQPGGQTTKKLFIIK